MLYNTILISNTMIDKIFENIVGKEENTGN